MQDQHFDEPVRVALGGSRNTIYKVERVAQAADILMNRWPAKTGRYHVAAPQSVPRRSRRPERGALRPRRLRQRDDRGCILVELDRQG